MLLKFNLTVSLGLKEVALGVTQVMWSYQDSGASAGLDLYFDTSNNLCFEALDGSVDPKPLFQIDLFRDPAAWYAYSVAIRYNSSNTC